MPAMSPVPQRPDYGIGSFAAPVELALDAQARFKGGVEQNGRRQHIDPPRFRDGALTVEKNRERNGRFGKEALHADIGFAHIDRDNRQPGRWMARCEPSESG